MSELKVNKLSPRSGTAVTLGDSGDTFTIPSGATLAIAGSVTGFTSAGIDDNATSVAITINSSEQVGIGTASPDHLLHISANSTNAQLKLQRTGSATASFNISASSDSLAFSDQAAGSERMRITSTGLGIGTSSPSEQLEIAGTGTQTLKIDRTDASTAGAITINSANDSNYIYNLTSKNLVFGTNNNARMTIDGSGSVGIGTSAPDTLLSLEKNNAPIIQFKDTSGATDEKIWRVNGLNDAYRIQTWNDALSSNQVAYQILRSGVDVSNHRFYTEDSERMRLTTTGLGIGTTSPDTTLSLEQNNAPRIQYKDTSGGTDAKVWRTMGLDSDYRLETRSDNLSNGQLAYVATRSGYVVNEHKFYTSDSEKMRIDSSGNVGIGETSTLAKLHVKSSDSGVTSLNSASDEFLIESSGSTGMTIASGTTEVGRIAFADSGNNLIGNVQYDHGNDSMTFKVNNSERMRIDSSGNVGISTSSPSYKLDVPSVSGARLSKSNVFIGKEVTASNGQTKTIEIATANAGSYFKVILTGIFASNAGLWTTHEYEKVYVNSSTGGGNSTISTVYSQNTGNFQFQSGDFAISRPGSGVVRIVYTVNGSNNGDIYLNVNVIGLGGRDAPSAITIT